MPSSSVFALETVPQGSISLAYRANAGVAQASRDRPRAARKDVPPNPNRRDRPPNRLAGVGPVRAHGGGDSDCGEAVSSPLSRPGYRIRLEAFSIGLSEAPTVHHVPRAFIEWFNGFVDAFSLGLMSPARW
jgi:hypothetical protein